MIEKSLHGLESGVLPTPGEILGEGIQGLESMLPEIAGHWGLTVGNYKGRPIFYTPPVHETQEAAESVLKIVKEGNSWVEINKIELDAQYYLDYSIHKIYKHKHYE